MASQPPPTARVQQGQAAAPGAEAQWKERLAKQREEFQKAVDDANATLKALRDELRWEQRRRGEVEAELDNLKKGAVAMMKYVTDLQRKKHEEEVEDLKRRLSVKDAGPSRQYEDVDDRVEVAKAPPTGHAGMRTAREAAAPVDGQGGASALERRERQVEVRAREVEEQFQRLKEERDLRRAEADGRLDRELGRLPEMQKLVVERDQAIQALRRELEDAHLRISQLDLALRRDGQGRPLSQREVDRAREEVDAVLVRQRHELNEKDAEIARLKADLQTKMRNTIALQRIKYEQEIEALKRDAGKGRRRRRP
jgi:chromosome segregation ATPase